MAKYTYLSTIESKTLIKQEEKRKNHGTKSILMVAKWEGCAGMGEEMGGLRSTNR